MSVIESRVTIVYCAINLINGKKYIGVSFDPEFQFRETA